MRVHVKSYYGHGHLHFLTVSCFHRAPLLATTVARDRVLEILERVRQKYEFVVVGYVIMPEHVHLLINEPEIGDPSLTMQVFKQRTSRALGHSGPRFWQLRFYDFNVFTERKRVEKLHYMHWNPVTRKLVESPEDWQWSSFRYYATGVQGTVAVDQGWKPIRMTQPRRPEDTGLLQKKEKDRAPIKSNVIRKLWKPPYVLRCSMSESFAPANTSQTANVQNSYNPAAFFGSMAGTVNEIQAAKVKVGIPRLWLGMTRQDRSSIRACMILCNSAQTRMSALHSQNGVPCTKASVNQVFHHYFSTASIVSAKGHGSLTLIQS